MNLPSMRRHRAAKAGLRTLVVGAGAAGRVAGPRPAPQPRATACAPVGFLDDDRPTAACRCGPAGPRPLSRAPEVARAARADAVVVAIPSLGRARRRQIGEPARALGLHVRYLPSFLAAVERDARAADLRSCGWSELLGRRELHVVRPDAAGCRGRSAGPGHRGGRIDRQRAVPPDPAASGRPRCTCSTTTSRTCTGCSWSSPARGCWTATRSSSPTSATRDRIDQVFAGVRPELVFHAAAHKHLPLLERHPCEGVKSQRAGHRTTWSRPAVRYGTSTGSS